MDAAGEPDREGACRHRAAGDRADRPDRVERVDDRASEQPLDAQGVRVLGDVGDGVHRAAEQEGGREGDDRGREASGEDAQARQRRPRDGDESGAEAPDQRSCGEPREDRAGREGGHGEAIRGVAEGEVALDLRVARDEVREQAPVGEEQGRDGDACPPDVRGGRVAHVVRCGERGGHVYERT